jgi:hypothetical protein
MSGYPAVYQPVVANPNDGENITLCKILDAVSTGTGGVAVANAAVGPDGVTRVPLNVNADGELKVNVEASISADLTVIENKLDTLIGIETPQAADVASIKNKLNTTIPVSVVGGSSGLVTLNGGYGASATLPAYDSIVGGTVTIGAGTANIGNVNPDLTGSGSVTPSTPLVITTTNNGTLAFQSNNAATGTVTIEGTVDGTTWTATTYVALTTGNSSSNFNAATPTIGQINTSALQAIRFRSNTITGTCGITYNISRNVSNVMLDNALPSGSNLIGSVNISTVSGLGTSTLTPAYESIVIPSSFVTGQAKIATTGTAVQLGSNALTQGVLISALSTNTASITIGTSSSLTNVVNGTGNGAILTAGSTKSIAATNTNLIWINGTAGDIISFIGS